MKRAVLNISLYVYGETDKEIAEQALSVIQELNKQDGAIAEIEDLISMPYGSAEPGESLRNLIK